MPSPTPPTSVHHKISSALNNLPNTNSIGKILKLLLNNIDYSIEDEVNSLILNGTAKALNDLGQFKNAIDNLDDECFNFLSKLLSIVITVIEDRQNCLKSIIKPSGNDFITHVVGEFEKEPKKYLRIATSIKNSINSSGLILGN